MSRNDCSSPSPDEIAITLSVNITIMIRKQNVPASQPRCAPLRTDKLPARAPLIQPDREEPADDQNDELPQHLEDRRHRQHDQQRAAGTRQKRDSDRDRVSQADSGRGHRRDRRRRKGS